MCINEVKFSCPVDHLHNSTPGGSVLAGGLEQCTWRMPCLQSVYKRGSAFLCAHTVCLWQSSYLHELKNFWDNYQTWRAVNTLVWMYVKKDFVLTKCVCVPNYLNMRLFSVAALFRRNAWGNQGLHHAWNATQVFLESTSHNCTWQSGAPATPTLSHWGGNSPNIHRELPGP